MNTGLFDWNGINYVCSRGAERKIRVCFTYSILPIIVFSVFFILMAVSSATKFLRCQQEMLRPNHEYKHDSN